MVDERPRENPRPSAPAPILEKFRAMVRDGCDVVDVYEKLLSDLTFNSKPIITELTIIAGDEKEDREGIADAICARILEVTVDQKLPSLYLLDSIVKNIGCEYVGYFSSRLPKVFCEAYNQVHSNLHPAMRHLFGTWSKVFHPSVLRKIKDELHFSSTENQRSTGLDNMRNPESASPRPSHGIHVNPKYLEARRQLQHSTAMAAIDSQNAAQASDFEKDAIDRLALESPEGWSGTSPKFHVQLQDVGQATGNSSTMHGYRQKSSIQSDDYDYDHPDVLPPRLGKANLPTTVAVRASAMTGNEEPNHLVKVKISNPLSSNGLRQRSASPLDDTFPRENSPLRVVEMASSPHSRLGFGPSRAINQNGWLERSWPSDVGTRQLGASTTYDSSNAYSKKRLRELIDAYGNYGGKSTSLEHPPKVQRIDVNGMDREVMTKNWQSSEEEEYVWEDMSPTLADQNRRNSLLLFGPTLGSLSRRVALSRPDVTILEPDFSRNSRAGQTRRLPVDDTPIMVNDKIPVLGSVHGSMNKKFPDGRGSSFNHYHHSQEPEKFSYDHQHELNARSWGCGPPVPLPSSAVTLTLPNDQKVRSPYDYSPDIEMPLQRLSSIHSDPSNVETCLIDKHMAIRPLSPPTGPAIVPPLNKSQPLPLFSVPPNQKHLKSPFSFMEVSMPMVNQGPKSSMMLSQQQFDAADRKTLISRKMIPLPHQQPGSIPMNQQSQEQGIGMASQSQEAHGGYIPFVPACVSSHTSAPPINHIQNQEKGIVKGSVLLNSLPAMAISLATHSVPDASSIQHGGIFPPLPPGPPPAPSQMEPASQSTGSAAGAFPGLISTLMAQGLISLNPPVQSEGFVGLEFNTELLKVRHESAIIALYADLPRQCTTCGMRFTCQEEHRSHMDWHVTKNRVSRNHKQNPSRKWFVNAKEWLSGTETVGTDVGPGFMPTETVVEKQEEKEMAVPADENQAVCALCGEPFEDFYSDEDEEWMYRGAVYLNAPDGHVEGLDRSQLGPIVHAKCRPDSSEGS